MIEVCIPLYGPPCAELECDEGKLDPMRIQELGKFVEFHLFRVADTVDRLQKSGWYVHDAVEFVLVFRNNVVRTLADALHMFELFDIPADVVEVFDVPMEE